MFDNLPPQDALSYMSSEDIYARFKLRYLSLFPESEEEAEAQNAPTREQAAASLEVEGNLIAKLMQAGSYEIYIERERGNYLVRACSPYTSTGTTLDHIAAITQVFRHEGESDEDLRRRMMLAFEGMATAGPIEAYKFHALAAHELVRDVEVEKPEPGAVLVTILIDQHEMITAPEVVNVVDAALNDEYIRPMVANVSVQPAGLSEFDVTASLEIETAFRRDEVIAAARAAVLEYADLQRRLGGTISVSAITSRLHQVGVTDVALTSPTANITTTNTTAPSLVNLTIT